jgi:hypothetical protein
MHGAPHNEEVLLDSRRNGYLIPDVRTILAAPRLWAVAEEVRIIPCRGLVCSIFEKTQQQSYDKKSSHLFFFSRATKQQRTEEDRRKQIR